MASYWERTLNRRVGRRRALLGAGGVGVSAAFLAACGSDDEDGSPTGSTGAVTGSTGNTTTTGSTSTGGTGAQSNWPDIIHTPIDTTASAVRGGTWKSYLTADALNFDLYNFDPFSQPFANAVGSKLVKVKPSLMEDPSLAVEPDVAEEWEVSPDRRTFTFKLNPNAKWAPADTPYYAGTPATIANRQIDSEDVLAAWERWGQPRRHRARTSS